MDGLLWAMGMHGFENYVEPLKIYLHKYRELEGDKATLAKQPSSGFSSSSVSLHADDTLSSSEAASKLNPDAYYSVESYSHHLHRPCSLDGKLQIWSVTNGHVVDWMDVREMVTTTCYTPDGQRGLVGTIKGNCQLYSIAGNKLQLDSQLVISRRKKKTSAKITSFQFAPEDSQKLLITSADARVRILDGDNVIFKYKGDNHWME